MKICRACSGRGLITLRLLPELSVTESFVESAMMSEHKDFPCPACSPSAPAERVSFVTTEGRVLIDHAVVRPDYVNHVKLRMAGDIGRHMLEQGHITFTERMEDPDLEFGRTPRKILTGKVGVITAGQVTTMDERAAIHQERLAIEVINEATYAINLWGSYFGHKDISKEIACREVRAALQAVLKRRESAK